MKRFHFPFDYKPKVSLEDTVVYASKLKQEIFTFFKEQYKAIYLDPALIVPNKESSLAYKSNDRFVSFDNKASNLVSAINNCQDNYLTIASSKFKRKNICTFAPLIKRDVKLSNTSSMINWIIDLELAMPEDYLNNKYFIDFAKQLFGKIVSFVNKSELKKIYEVSNKKIKVSDWKVVEAQKLENSYLTLTLKQGLNHICSSNRFVIIENNFKKLKSNQSIEQYSVTAQDWENSCGIYVYDYINEAPINLINICKRPSGDKSYNQLRNTNPLELDNEIYDQIIFDKDRPTNMSVTINFTNLIYYLLDKVHLAEVVSSVWPEDFLEFVKTEKIDIL